MSKRKLLLADDSITIQKVVNLTFADEGIEVISVGDGDEAMRKFTESSPDLVMADVNMPGMDGYSICEMIKADETTRKIPVILLVGSFEPFDEEKARNVGADDYLTKPFQSIRQLVHKVSSLLQLQNGESVRENEFTENIQPKSADELQSELVISDELGDAGMDDETIQTAQIGSLPANEYQKFESGAENYRETSGETDVTERFPLKFDSENQILDVAEAETQPLSEEAFEKITENSGITGDANSLERKIYEFADEQKNSENENVYSAKPDDSDVRDLIEQSYSTETKTENSSTNETREIFEDDNDSINEMLKAGREDINSTREKIDATSETAQEKVEPILDFDDFNLLEIPEPAEDVSESISEAEFENSHQTSERENEELLGEQTPKIEFESENQAANYKTEEVSGFDKSAAVEQDDAETQNTEEASEEKSEILADFPPEVIEALAEKVFEKLSYRALKEIADQVAPQMADLIVLKMEKENANE